MGMPPKELLRDRRLSWADKAVAYAMWTCIPRDDARPICWMSHAALGTSLGTSKRVVERVVRELAAFGWLDRIVQGERWVTELRPTCCPIRAAVPASARRRVRDDEAGQLETDSEDAELGVDPPQHGPLSIPQTYRGEVPPPPETGGGGDAAAEGAPTAPRSPVPEGINKNGQKAGEGARAHEDAGIDLEPRPGIVIPPPPDGPRPLVPAPHEPDLSGDVVFELASTPAQAPRKATAVERRTEQAREVWRTYEARRLELWPRAHGRQATPQDLRAIVRLVEYVRDREQLDEASAWKRVREYGMGALEHAHDAPQFESPEWADKIKAWRSDGAEWGRKRFDKWRAGADGGGGRPPRRKGHARAEDSDHNEEPVF